MIENKRLSKREVLFKNEESNEMTTSLKLFLARTLVNGDNFSRGLSIDKIKEDFENNGVIVDEFSKPNKLQKDLLNFPREKIVIRKCQFESLKDVRRTPKKSSKNVPSQFCVFCGNNNEPDAVVRSHAVRDIFGKVLCPKLRTYTCPICGVSGDRAHTLKYCPKKPIITMEDTIAAEGAGLRLFPFQNRNNILNV